MKHAKGVQRRKKGAKPASQTKKDKNKGKSAKKTYRVRNWSEYNQALVRRGSLDLWMDTETVDGWQALPTGEPGAPLVYANTAILCALTIRNLFHLPLRATEGLLGSIRRLVSLNLPIPDYTTLSRRGASLYVPLCKETKEKTVIIVDSSGVKVYGEGEWKVRQHGASKRRTWKKIHIAIDENGEIRATDVTGNDVHDSEVAPALISKEEAKIVSFAGDGAYDTGAVYDSLVARDVECVLVPPQKNAKIWKHGNSSGPEHPRDRNLRMIRQMGRAAWKERTGYHIRSLVENTMFRFKTTFGDRVLSREWNRQVTELTLKCAMLNRMRDLGRPESYAVTA